MEEILEQIQSLTDKFNNLFEVEGLGEPSGDVPPSTNKIKKDKKTKDGKVELVSVEDELFPKEGNAKEQFRQKVIDKINGMIQGTATLEDLLQLVRSKQVKPVKEGFEGAIEILNSLLEGGDNILGVINRAEEKGTIGHEKAENLKNKAKRVYDSKSYDKKVSGNAKKSSNLRTNSNSDFGSEDDYALNRYHKPEYGEGIQRYKSKERHYRELEKKPMKEGFEGAIELLEEIINEVSDDLAKRASKESHDRYNRVRTAHDSTKELIKRNKKSNFFSDEEIKELKDKLKQQKEELKKAGRVSVRDNHNQLNRDIRLGKIPEGFEGAVKLLEEIINEVSKERHAEAAKNSCKDRMLDYYDKYYELDTTDGVPTEGDIEELKRKEKRYKHAEKVANESFEQAINILEEIINEVSVGKLSRALDNSVEKRQKEAQAAREKAENAPKGSNSVLLNAQARKANRRSQDAQVLKSLKLPKDSKVSANKLFKSAEKALPHRENEVTKNSNSSSYSRYRRAWDIADTNPVKYNKSESFEQAINILETALDAIKKSDKSNEKKSELKSKLVNARDKERELANKKAWDSWVKGERKSNTTDTARTETRNTKGERKTRLRSPNNNYRSDGFSKTKPEWKQVEDSIKRHEKKVANESFEQAISQIKDLIDCLGESKSQEELSSVAKKVLPQREENARKAHDELNKVTDKLSPYNMLNGKLSQRQRETVANALNKAEKADSKVAHAKSYLEKPKEKQQTGMRFDKILCSCEEELNASKEILENLYKGINKKFNKGELSVSDALRLEKKVQDKISPEKRKHDGKELEAEMKSSLEPEIQVNKTLKALRRNDKKNNQGKANYKFTFDYKPVEEAIKILELFDRPDLIDDISKCLTKKTVKQHLEDTAKKIINGKKKVK